MVGSLIVYALTLIGPAALAGGYRHETRGGLMVVLVMSLAAALTLGVLLGRWLSQRPPKGGLRWKTNGRSSAGRF